MEMPKQPAPTIMTVSGCLETMTVCSTIGSAYVKPFLQLHFHNMITTDPLDALRAAISSKYDITPVTSTGSSAGSLSSATHVRLSSSTTLPKSAATRLRKAGSSATDPIAQPDGFFMLEAVYLAWLLRDTPGGEYMRQAREHGLPAGGFVSLTERKSIVDWLRRAIPALDSIVPLSGACWCCCLCACLIVMRDLKSRRHRLAHRRPRLTAVCTPHRLRLLMHTLRRPRRAAHVETLRRRRLVNGTTYPMPRMWRL